MPRTIVITGGAGFVGVNLVQLAHASGYRIIVADTWDRLGRLQRLKQTTAHPAFTFMPIDLATQHLDLEGVDLLIHLAALPQVDYSLYYPDLVWTNNVHALKNVVESAARYQVPLLFVSSIEVYGGNEGALFSETDPYRPLSPYADSKVVSEEYLRSQIAAGNLEGGIVRLTNLYGSWQAPDRVIPRLITQILSGYPCEVDRGRLRDFLHVEDAVRALLLIAERERRGEVYNIAAGQGYDNYHLISLLQEATQLPIEVRSVEAKQGDGRGKALVSSSQKLQEALAWSPSLGLAEGLARTFAWYMEHKVWWRQFDGNIRSDRSTPNFLTDHTHDLHNESVLEGRESLLA